MSSSAPVLAKAEPGASWKANEHHVVPKNRLGIVLFGLMMCCTFLVALDQGSFYWSLACSIYVLYGLSASMLASASLGPLYAKASDILVVFTGRKPVLYGCIIVFLVSNSLGRTNLLTQHTIQIDSGMCGASQNMT
ncbi:hypothetical protein JVU11DRAFT_802 [Chiua virens]|nr:hypothetical protein JVU11DRAFT_802 [Chiua virens]